MFNKKNTIINLFAALITLGVQMFIGFWLSPYVIGKLGEEAYGFLDLANNFVSYAGLVAVSINSMACRYISVEYNRGNLEESKKYFCSVFIANCVLYAIILIASLILIGNIEIFLNVSTKLVTQVKFTFFLAFINMGISMIGTVYTAAAFVTNLMYYNSLIQIISNIIKSTLIFVLFILLQPQIYYLSIATLISSIIIFIGNYTLTRKLLKEFDIKVEYYDFKKLIRLVKSGIWVFVSNISNLLLNGLDLLLSNWFISSTIMGRLSLAKQIPLALGNALGVFLNISSSALTKVFAENGEKSLIDETDSQLKILNIFFSVPYAGVIIFGREFISLWLKGANYTQEQQIQIYILMLLVLIDIITSTYMYSIHSIFIAVDKVKKYAIILFTSSCISFGLTVLLLNITNWGVYVIAGTSTIVLGLTHGFIVPACAAKLLGKPYYLFWKTEGKSWLSLGFLCVLFYIMKIPMDFTKWVQFFINIIICTITGYGILAFFILEKEEKKKIVQVVKKRIKKK